MFTLLHDSKETCWYVCTMASEVVVVVVFFFTKVGCLLLLNDLQDAAFHVHGLGHPGDAF